MDERELRHKWRELQGQILSMVAAIDGSGVPKYMATIRLELLRMGQKVGQFDKALDEFLGGDDERD